MLIARLRKITTNLSYCLLIDPEFWTDTLARHSQIEMRWPFTLCGAAIIAGLDIALLGYAPIPDLIDSIGMRRQRLLGMFVLDPVFIGQDHCLYLHPAGW